MGVLFCIYRPGENDAPGQDRGKKRPARHERESRQKSQKSRKSIVGKVGKVAKVEKLPESRKVDSRKVARESRAFFHSRKSAESLESRKSEKLKVD